VRRLLASPYTAPACLLVLVLMFFFITVVVAISTSGDTVDQLVRLQNKVVQTNEDLVDLGRAQVCMTGVDIEERGPATTNWCLIENGQDPLYVGVEPMQPDGEGK
jgi:hypothetical protein